MRRFATLLELSSPNDWVFGIAQTLNYTARAGNEWRRRPCFRSGYIADRMFTGELGLPDSGSCNKGVLYDCPPIYRSNNYEDCWPKDSDDAGKECIRRTGFSALYWPFWCPAYPAAPMTIYMSGNDPNELLMARQMALLSNPDANLQVNENHVLDVADTFVEWYLDQLEVYAPPGARYGLLAIDSSGSAPGTAVKDRLTIDEEQRVDWAPAPSDRNKFYFDRYGMIRAYDFAGVDPASWGVRAAGGVDQLAVSVASYNAVVGNTYAFFTARTSFLRNGPIMNALVREYGANRYSSSVRPAVQYAADVGKMLPHPSQIARPQGGTLGDLAAAPFQPPARMPKDHGEPPDRLKHAPLWPNRFALSRPQAAGIALGVGLLAAWQGPRLVEWISRKLRG
jgi:hypothetical protein